jgi:hypothetical protein
MVVVVGATATHLIHHESQVMTTLVLAALLTIVLYLSRGASARGSKPPLQAVPE